MKRCLLFLLVPFCLISVEHSVFPYNIQLNSKKYTKKQLEEIARAQSGPTLRVMSYNVLFDGYSLNLEPMYLWPERAHRVVQLIRHINPDVIGVQEPSADQVNCLLKDLPHYDFYAARSFQQWDGIFYRKDRLELIEATVWNFCNVSYTLIHLRDKVTGKDFGVSNIHLSFSDPEIREKQVRSILKVIDSLDYPLIVMGDMNTFPNRPELEKLPFLDGDYIEQLFVSTKLTDSRHRSLLGHLGPLSSFTNVGEDPAPFKGQGTPGVILDHIYTTPDIQVLIHAIDPATVDGYYPSDHMPVIIDISQR